MPFCELLCGILFRKGSKEFEDAPGLTLCLCRLCLVFIIHVANLEFRRGICVKGVPV